MAFDGILICCRHWSGMLQSSSRKFKQAQNWNNSMLLIKLEMNSLWWHHTVAHEQKTCNPFQCVCGPFHLNEHTHMLEHSMSCTFANMFCSAIFNYPNIYFLNRMVPWTPLPKYCIAKLSDHPAIPTIRDTLPSLMPANVTYYYGFSTPLASHYCAHKTLVLSALAGIKLGKVSLIAGA